jgi:TM2 domain-containing membrane protein YozV
MGLTEKSPKKGWVALLLCIVLGVFGIHRIYVGRINFLYILTGGWLGIGVILDFFKIVAGSFLDVNGRRVSLLGN